MIRIFDDEYSALFSNKWLQIYYPSNKIIFFLKLDFKENRYFFISEPVTSIGKMSTENNSIQITISGLSDNPFSFTVFMTGVFVFDFVDNYRQNTKLIVNRLWEEQELTPILFRKSFKKHRFHAPLI